MGWVVRGVGKLDLSHNTIPLSNPLPAALSLRPGFGMRPMTNYTLDCLSKRTRQAHVLFSEDLRFFVAHTEFPSQKSKERG